MATEVRLGKLSPTMETGTINRWLKKVGDAVSAGEVIAEVETDKASMPLEAFDDGTLLKILVPEGHAAKVDQIVAVIGAHDEDISALVPQAGTPTNGAAAPKPAKAAQKQEAKAAVHAEAKTPPAQTAPVAPPSAAQTNETQAPEPQKQPAEEEVPARPTLPATAAKTAPRPATEAKPESGRVRASPLARKLAAERRIDLRTITPSGPGGRVIQRDVPQAAETAETADQGPNETEIPLSNLRQTIARRLVQSKQSIPHFYLFSDVRMENLLALREELNAGAVGPASLPAGAKISINDLIVKVAAAALARHPEVNVSFGETSIRQHGEINIAVAVSTDNGLYVPVLRNADKLSLSEISAGVRALAAKARDRKLTAAEQQGSGFTISNLGMYGVDHFFAIINPPEAAILAVGAIESKPVVNAAGQVVAGKVMGITLSCDHRAIDGAAGAKFLATLKDLLEHPAKLLL